MANTAAHLVDNVLPEVPNRQWVLSFPKRVRFLLARDHDLLSEVLGGYSTAKAAATAHLPPEYGGRRTNGPADSDSPYARVLTEERQPIARQCCAGGWRMPEAWSWTDEERTAGSRGTEARRSVLVVNQDRATAQQLAVQLEDMSFTVATASDRNRARAALDGVVDLVLLDAQLEPDHSTELVPLLKAGVPEQFLPVVLVSACRDHEARVRGLAAGGDDFLVMPIEPSELNARARTLIALRDKHAELHRANTELRDVNVELLRAQARKRTLASMMVHDLRNPLTALQGYVDVLSEELSAETDTPGVAEMLHSCRTLCETSLSTVAGLLDVEELEAGLLVARTAEYPVLPICERASRHHGLELALRKLTLEFRIDATLQARCDADLVERLVENLLDNSVRYARRKGLVVVEARREESDLVIRVGNDGPPIPESERGRIFDRYYRLEARRAGARANRGLGLFFCKLVADAHRGTLEILEQAELPATFELRIPQTP